MALLPVSSQPCPVKFRNSSNHTGNYDKSPASGSLLQNGPFLRIFYILHRRQSGDLDIRLTGGPPLYTINVRLVALGHGEVCIPPQFLQANLFFLFWGQSRTR